MHDYQRLSLDIVRQWIDAAASLGSRAIRIAGRKRSVTQSSVILRGLRDTGLEFGSVLRMLHTTQSPVFQEVRLTQSARICRDLDERADL